MASHIDSKISAPKGRNKTGPKVKVIAPMPRGIENAISQARTPECSELFAECKCILGATLIGLRNANDAVKLANAIAQVVKAVSVINSAEKLEMVNITVIEKMTDEELKAYASKLLDKI